jgi:2-keto-4-pentenoate hydratase/2-oxohepta-3-ene-1,7-dioic acid hydratase in catechol pathway
MKIIRFDSGTGGAYGLVEGDTVRELSQPPFQDIRPNGRSFSLSSVRLLAPCVPSKIFALAFNARRHLGGKAPPAEPQIFLKVPSSVISPGDTIVLPPGQGRVDEEAELVVVIGRRCRNVGQKDALGYVFGYSCGNDVSARVWQKRDLNWWRAKSSDTFAPLGPFIVTDVDASDLDVTGRIDGREVQRFSTRELLFGIPAIIEWISAAVTLEPGDLIFTGTSGDPAEISAGNTVEVEIDGIGLLSNPVALGGER